MSLLKDFGFYLGGGLQEYKHNHGMVHYGFLEI